MNTYNTFDINSIETPTKEDITVTFTPGKDTQKAIVRIFNNGEKVDIQRYTGNKPIIITLVDSGNLQIQVTTIDSYNREETYKSGIYKIDKEAPGLAVGNSKLSLYVGDKINVMGGVKAVDKVDGDITNKVVSNITELDLTTPGTKELIYTVSDAAGNVTTKTVVLELAERNITGLLIVQSGIIIVLLALIVFILKYRKTLNLEKRYGKYSVEPLVDQSPSLSEKATGVYKRLVSWLTSKIKKSAVVKDYSKRLNKYLLFTKDTYQTSMDIVSAKIIVGFIFLIIAIVSKTLQYKILSFYEMIIPFTLGFFTLDVVYALQYRFYRERMENDLLQAIIIMNNAFKSGRSIVQAIELIGNELPGVIGDQFRRMRKEMATGLSVEDVFRRFAERIDFEEVTYLTASLTILNKTGGNIIKVFSSIERSLFLKKRLKTELKSLTGSSRIIMWVLFFVPVFFAVAITFLNPGYFNPFFQSNIGIILFALMMVLYIIYIFVVRKILKVRM